MELKDKVYLVTGGSSGIGKATAALLVEKGAKVAITGRDKEKLESVAAAVGALAVHGDAGNPADVEPTFKAVLDHFGQLDGLINNAGIGGRRMLEEVTWEYFQEIYSVNVFGAAMLAQKAAEIFKAQNRGDIINIASTAALNGYPGGTVYSSSKFALRGMTQAWRHELRRHNIRVILINPSEVTTAFASPERTEREEVDNKLRPYEIAHTIVSTLEMDPRGYVPEVSIHATNPF